MSFTASAKKWRAMGGRWWTKENMIGKKGTKLIGGGFLLFRGGGGPAIFFNIKIVLPPQRDQINRGRFFNPESTLYWMFMLFGKP